MTDEIIGTVVEVLICDSSDSIKSTVKDIVDVTFEGFIGDKHSGLTKPSDSRTKFYPRGTIIRNSRQISIVSKEEIDSFCRTLGMDTLLPEWMGANLLLNGIPELTSLKPNTRMFFSSGAVLLVTSDNLPCTTMTEEIIKNNPSIPDLKEKVIPASMGKRGIVAVVELPGQIKKGDTVRVVYTER